MVEIGRQDSDPISESCRFVRRLFAGLGYHSLCSCERVEPFLFLCVHIGGAPITAAEALPKVFHPRCKALPDFGNGDLRLGKNLMQVRQFFLRALWVIAEPIA